MYTQMRVGADMTTRELAFAAHFGASLHASMFLLRNQETLAYINPSQVYEQFWSFSCAYTIFMYIGCTYMSILVGRKGWETSTGQETGGGCLTLDCSTVAYLSCLGVIHMSTRRRASHPRDADCTRGTAHACQSDCAQHSRHSVAHMALPGSTQPHTCPCAQRNMLHVDGRVALAIHLYGDRALVLERPQRLPLCAQFPRQYCPHVPLQQACHR
jgi:hypothetical protein